MLLLVVVMMMMMVVVVMTVISQVLGSAERLALGLDCDEVP